MSDDAMVAVLLIVGVGAVLAIASGKSPAQYARGEWRLAWMKTWAPEEDPGPCTVGDPRVAKMDLRQRSLGKRMRRDGRTLLAGKQYLPALTKPAPVESAPKANKVVPIRRPAR